MTNAPKVAVLDVNETLADLSGLRARFEEVDAPGDLLDVWFAATLRDGFALTAAGAYADFREVALGALEAMVSREAAEHVLAGFPELDLHPDVAPGLEALREAGVRCVTLTNGAAELTEKLLKRGGVADLVDLRLSVSDAGRWKPAPEPYLMAAERCGVPIAEMALIAAHPWDVDGAVRAGMRGAWLNRRGAPYPAFFSAPAAAAANLPELADALTR